jgi:type II secretory pathway pseudopilin PulG
MQVRERLSRLEVGSSRAKTLPFGLTGVEIVAAFIAVAVLAIAVTYFSTSLRTEQARLRQVEQQLADQERDIDPATGELSSGASPGDLAREALESLERFKTGHLKPMRSGEIELLNGLNALAKKTGVQLASGIDTTSRMPGQAEEDTTTESKATRSRKKEEILNVFPELEARFTVAGEYPNLRSFISALESGRQFVVVKTIGITSQEGRAAGRGSRGPAGSLVLSIEMTAYFRPR